MTDTSSLPYIASVSDVPHELLTTAKAKAGVDHNGQPRLDDKGQPIKVSVVAAKLDGSYKGDVLLNGTDWLAQAVGKQRTTIVMHRKSDLNLVSDRLKWLDENKRMNATNIQVHYEGNVAKVYPWDPEKDKSQTATPGKNSPNKSQTTHENKKTPTIKEFVEAANKYADSITNIKSREAFRKHIGAVLSKFERAPEPSLER